jgi:hypothetical protein
VEEVQQLPDVERGGVAEAVAGTVHVINLKAEVVDARDDGPLCDVVGA